MKPERIERKDHDKWTPTEQKLARSFRFASFTEAAHFGSLVERLAGQVEIDLAVDNHTLFVQVDAADTLIEAQTQLTEKIDTIYSLMTASTAS